MLCKRVMLNLPLSLLSDDLLSYIVDQVAWDPWPPLYEYEDLHNLSLSDRAFTQFCQVHIFKKFSLTVKDDIHVYEKLAKMRKILDDEPSFVNRVRIVKLNISHNRNEWLFNDPTFISILQLLAKSLEPPHELHLSGIIPIPLTFEDPILFVGRLTQSFFSQTLAVLRLYKCNNVPLTLFLVCPRLRDIHLTTVESIGATEMSYDGYSDEQCSARELPAPEYLTYSNAQSVIKQMITPPARYTSVIIWSKLRVLKLFPRDLEDLACVQPILDAACSTLEELHLIEQPVAWAKRDEHLPLSGLVNLRHCPRLRDFALKANIKCGVQESVVLHDISVVLSTIPTSNQVTDLSLDLVVWGGSPFPGVLEEDWAGICDGIERITGEKDLKLILEISIRSSPYDYPPAGAEQLFKRIKEKTASLYEHLELIYSWHD